MNAQVALQGLQVAEAGATGVAGVRLLPCVDQNVGPQMGDLTPGKTTQTEVRSVSRLEKKTISAQTDGMCFLTTRNWLLHNPLSKITFIFLHAAAFKPDVQIHDFLLGFKILA